jgi:hypothetical protein
MFWVALVVVFVVFVIIVGWAARGFDERTHKPGTQRLR